MTDKQPAEKGKEPAIATAPDPDEDDLDDLDGAHPPPALGTAKPLSLRES